MKISDFGPNPEGSTPLDPEDIQALRLGWVSNRADLNFAEGMNISQAREKYFAQNFTRDEILDDHFIRKLHLAMFGDVWSWAGKYRTKELNIGVNSHDVPVDVRNLLENAKYWFGSEGPVELDSVSCEIHHQLVKIHPFANGNGRLCRLVADLLLKSLGRPKFEWGGVNLENESDIRSQYIAALRAADRGELKPLVAFVRSGAPERTNDAV
jgi:Fic-DOC domain mobile mystery protein B